jgi:hypothetical protein
VRSLLTFAVFLFALAGILSAGVITYGDEDCLGQNCYSPADPVAGATLQGLAAGTVTLASTAFGHGYPFSPSADFPGTDQIYVGSTQTASLDGYSAASQRINGPAVFTLDYSSLLGPGQTPATLTLGIAADDFQFVGLQQPFTASVNGVVNAALTAQLNSFDEAGPIVQFFTIGLDPLIDTPSHILQVSIDEGGNGGDGYAVDFLTVGVTTATVAATSEPSSFALLAAGIGLVVISRARRRT